MRPASGSGGGGRSATSDRAGATRRSATWCTTSARCCGRASTKPGVCGDPRRRGCRPPGQQSWRRQHVWSITRLPRVGFGRDSSGISARPPLRWSTSPSAWGCSLAPGRGGATCADPFLCALLPLPSGERAGVRGWGSRRSPWGLFVVLAGRLRDWARLRRAFDRLSALESLFFAGPKKSNQKKWPCSARGEKRARSLFALSSESLALRGAAAALPRALGS